MLSSDLVDGGKRTTADRGLGIHSVVNGMWTCPVARTSILRIRRGRLAAGFLPGTPLPRRSRDSHEASPSTPTRQFDWVLRGIWRLWGRRSPLRCGSSGTS
jgi:hypothetical protein